MRRTDKALDRTITRLVEAVCPPRLEDLTLNAEAGEEDDVGVVEVRASEGDLSAIRRPRNSADACRLIRKIHESDRVASANELRAGRKKPHRKNQELLVAVLKKLGLLWLKAPKQWKMIPTHRRAISN
jgi:hypothetical protein